MFGKGREPGWREVYLVVSQSDNTENLSLGKFIKEKIGWDKTSKDKLRAIIEIASNVVVYSDQPSIPALSVNAVDFRSYDQLFVIVKENASIYGAAGSGGAGGGQTSSTNTSDIQVNGSQGGSGGTAFFADRPVRLINHGNIYGGGGGGGGGGGHKGTSSSSGSSSTRCESGTKGKAGGQHCCKITETFTKEVCKK